MLNIFIFKSALFLYQNILVDDIVVYYLFDKNCLFFLIVKSF